MEQSLGLICVTMANFHFPVPPIGQLDSERGKNRDSQEKLSEVETFIMQLEAKNENLSGKC